MEPYEPTVVEGKLTICDDRGAILGCLYYKIRISLNVDESAAFRRWASIFDAGRSFDNS